MPLIDTEHATEIPVPTPHEIVATSPRIPGLEIRIPADVVLQTQAGPLRSLTLTQIPPDRAPFPTPPGGTFVFTPQAHGPLVLRPDGTPSPAGVFTHEKTDLVVPDVIPIVLRRAHRAGDPKYRQLGSSDFEYQMYITGNPNDLTWIKLILADGGVVRYDRISGTTMFDSVFEH